MPSFTPNFNLTKPTETESYDIGVPNTNMDIIDTQLKAVSDKVERYGTATGTNTLVLNLTNAPTSLYPGLTVRFKNTVANTGNVTLNVNGLGNVPLIKNGGGQISVGGLKTNGVYTVTYDGLNFTLQGEGGDSLIKNIYRGSTTIVFNQLTSDVSIPSVNVNKSVIRISFTGSITVASQFFAMAEFVNPTTLRFTRNATANGLNVMWEVIEYIDEVMVYSGSTTITSPSFTIEIPNVNMNKSFQFCSYSTTSTENLQSNRTFSVTNLGISTGKNTSSGTDIIKWQLVTYP